MKKHSLSFLSRLVTLRFHLDLFEPLTHRNVKYNVTLTYAILVLFTWSMLQFCLVAMATAGSDDVSEGSIQHKVKENKRVRWDGCHGARKTNVGIPWKITRKLNKLKRC